MITSQTVSSSLMDFLRPYQCQLTNNEVPELKESKNLLLVDDTELFLTMEKSFLERREFILHTARSGSEALERSKIQNGL